MSSYDEISMTPDQFFDELDTLFRNTDGYVPHLAEIKKIKEENDRLLCAIQDMYDYVERIGNNERICVETILERNNVTNYEKTEEEPAKGSRGEMLMKERDEAAAKDICCQCPLGSCDEHESYRDMIKAIDEDGDEILFAPKCLADNDEPTDYSVCLDCDVYHHDDISETHLVHRMMRSWCPGCWKLKTPEELDRIVGPAV